MENAKWFKEAKFGMMIHWGLYSLLAGEYKGKRTDKFGEWIQSKMKIPKAEYEKLAAVFNPIYFDAEEWVLTAKNAGMQYIVITSKHHDGFCLYHSKYDKFNVVDATPFKRDIIKELATACKKHGLKLGLYYSQEVDWREPDGGGYDIPEDPWELLWTNDWDFPNNDIKDYERLFQTKIKAQVKEILTGYGDLALVWFDTPHVIKKRQSEELYHLVKSIQPDCLVSSRIGNGVGDYHSLGDNALPEDSVGDKLVESPVTLNDTWAFKYFDDNWKSAEQVLAIKEKVNARGANLLLNIGPDHLGRIPAPSLEILQKVGELLKKE
jgi:alpha-L-fucosidase